MFEDSRAQEPAGNYYTGGPTLAWNRPYPKLNLKPPAVVGPRVMKMADYFSDAD